MNDRSGFVSATGLAVGVLTLAGLLGVTAIFGPVPFSPGALNAQSKGRMLGGVASHAQTGGNCEACHTLPWSPQTMADRCMACHTDVASQIQSRSGLHAGLVGSASFRICRGCHTDHRGPAAALTIHFDHSKLPFKLVGRHAGVACGLCHANAGSLSDLRKTPRECFSCHAKDDKHAGSFGQRCEQCHTPVDWAKATFDHTVFPVDHGSSEQKPTCQTCHPNGLSTYTCFGCHRHTPANVVSEHEGRSLADLTDCIRCHRGGRREGGDG